MNTASENTPHLSPLLERLATLRGAAGAVHPRFGDLSRPDAVCMSPMPLVQDGHREDDDVIIHLTVTGQCNARCEGCINTALEAGCGGRGEVMTEFECDPARDADTIVRVAQACGDRPVTVAMYGGEPLLEAGRISELLYCLDSSPIASRVQYMLYTNGQLLDSAITAYPDLWNRVRLLSVSIDGDARQHNRFRPGTDLSTIQAGLARLRETSDCDVLFWSTLREQQSLRNCFDQFMEYVDDSLVGHLFWHWAESPEPYQDLAAYVDSYAAELESVLDVYVEHLRNGRLLSIIHVNELVLYLLTGRVRGHSACAVELAENYDIVGGRLSACADLPLSLGLLPQDDNGESLMSSLRSLVSYREVLRCCRCGVYPYCGGRCPVQVLAGSPERTLQLCQLMRLHVGLVQERLDDIRTALHKAGVTVDDLYRHSARLTRYTDVVP